jgi:uncharacterized protein YggE
MNADRNTLLVTLALALIVPVLALTGCVGTSPASVPDINLGGQQEGIWVTGRGEVQAVPDVASLNLGVQAQATSVAVAQQQASQAMDAVMTALENSGVAEKDIQTTSFNIWQQSRWDPDTQQEIVTGYQVSNSIQVTVRDVETVGEVIDAAVTAGGDYIRVNGIQFEVDDPSGYLEEAREKAMADAKAKAAQLADLADVTLGEPSFITEGSQTPVVYAPREYAMSDSMEAAGAPAISPGETTIVATVQIVYDID